MTNKRSVFKYVIRFIAGLLVGIFIGNFLINITFNLNQGPERIYEIGNGYEIFGWPPHGGYLVYWKSGDESEYERIVYPEKISEFSFDKNWIFGKTNNGWFAVNKNTHTVDLYPTEEEMKSKIRLLSDNYRLINDPSPFERIHPWTKTNLKKAQIASFIIIFAMPLLFAFLPNVWRVTKKHICSEHG